MQGASNVAKRFSGKNPVLIHHSEDFQNVILTHFRVNLKRFEENYGIFLFKKCITSELKLRYLRNFYETPPFKAFTRPIRSFWPGSDWEFQSLVHEALSENFFVKNGNREDCYYIFDLDSPRESWKKMGTVLFPFLFTFADNSQIRHVFLCYSDVLDILSAGDFNFFFSPEPGEDLVKLEALLNRMNEVTSETVAMSLLETQNLKNLVQKWIANMDLLCQLRWKYAEVSNFQESTREK